MVTGYQLDLICPGQLSAELEVTARIDFFPPSCLESLFTDLELPAKLVLV